MLSSAAAAFLVATAAADPEPGRSAPASAPAAPPVDPADAAAAAAVARCNVRQSNQAIRENIPFRYFFPLFFLPRDAYA